MTTPLPVRDLTGGQVEELIDTLLYGALRPIVEHTDLFSPQLAFILSLIVSNKKRKPCTTDVTTATYYLVRVCNFCYKRSGLFTLLSEVTIYKIL